LVLFSSFFAIFLNLSSYNSYKTFFFNSFIKYLEKGGAPLFISKSSPFLIKRSGIVLFPSLTFFSFLSFIYFKISIQFSKLLWALIKKNIRLILPKYSSKICSINLLFSSFIIPGVSINLIPTFPFLKVYCEEL